MAANADRLVSAPGFPLRNAASAFQPWVHNGKPSILIRDMAMYYRIDPELRTRKWAEWNRPVYWPLALLLVGALWLVWRLRASHAERERAVARPAEAVGRGGA